MSTTVNQKLASYTRLLVSRKLREDEVVALLLGEARKRGVDLSEGEAKAFYHAEASTRRDELNFYRPCDLKGVEIQKPEYIVDPILPRRRLILLVGNSTTGKTPFVYQLASEVTSGRDFLGYFPHRGRSCRVAIVDAESPIEDIQLRRQAQGQDESRDNPIIFDMTQVIEQHLFLDARGIGRLSQFVAAEKIDLLVLDNLWALSAGLDILKAHVVQPILRGLRSITILPHGPSVFLLHHPRKGPREKKQRASILQSDFAHWLEEASGSYVLINLTDVRLGLERVEVRDEEYTIFRGRSRVPGCEQDIGPLYLTVDEEHSLAAIDRRPEAIQDLGDKAARVFGDLRTLCSPFTMQQAYQASGGSVSRKTVRRTMAFLKAHAWLKETEAGWVWL